MQTRWRLMTDAQYYRFCMTIPDLRIERTAEGDILIMSPGGVETSWRNGELTMQLGNWAQKEGRGRAFDSSVEYDPDHRTAYIYPPDREPEQLVNPERIPARARGRICVSASRHLGGTVAPRPTPPETAPPSSCAERYRRPAPGTRA